MKLVVCMLASALIGCQALRSDDKGLVHQNSSDLFEIQFKEEIQKLKKQANQKIVEQDFEAAKEILMNAKKLQRRDNRYYYFFKI